MYKDTYTTASKTKVYKTGNSYTCIGQKFLHNYLSTNNLNDLKIHHKKKEGKQNVCIRNVNTIRRLINAHMRFTNNLSTPLHK